MKITHSLLFATLLFGGCSSGEPNPENGSQADSMSAMAQTRSADDASRDEGDQAMAGSAQAGAYDQPGAPPVDRADRSNAALPEGALRVQPVKIIDRKGFERPMVAATALIPFGWQTKGGVFWKPSTCGNGVNVLWSATSPDGDRGISLIPGEKWKWSNYPSGPDGCPTAQITSIRQYLESVVSRVRPGARIVDFRKRADLEKPYEHFNRVIPTGGVQLTNHIEAGEVLVSYAGQNGQPMRESFAAAALFSETRSAGINGQPMITVGGQTLGAFAAFAPDGQLDFNASETLRQSIKASPDWEARIAKHTAALADETTRTYGAINETNARAASERLELNAATSRYISENGRRAVERRSQENEVMQRELGEWVNDVETYNDADSPTGAVQLSYNYDNAWRLDDGSYVLTSDPNFDPYKTTGIHGRQLEKQE